MRLVYKKIEEGADVNFVFGAAYGAPEGYTPLMAAAHRSRLEACKALLRAGADPNFCNSAGDLVLFWAIDGGVEVVKLLVEVRNRAPRRWADVTPAAAQYGVDLDARTPKDWTGLSYARAKGKYGVTHEKGVYPEDVLKYYGASAVGSGPPSSGSRRCGRRRLPFPVGSPLPRSPRESYNPEDDDFQRDRGSYQNVVPHP